MIKKSMLKTSKLQANNKGFGIIEVIVVLVIVASLATIGVLAYKNHHKAEAITKSTTPTTTVTTAPPVSSLTDASLILQRQQHIDSYVTANTNRNYTAAYYTPLYSEGYLTTTLNSKIQSQASYDSTGPADSANPAYDIFMCINLTPSSYSYGTASISSGNTTATLPVSVFTSGSTTPTSFTANWVKSKGVWQLNSSVCSQE